MRATRLAALWLPVVAWAALIFALSAIPSLGTGLGFWDLLLRKLAHLTEYAVLGALLARAVSEPAAFVLGVGYAVTDEVHQHFVDGRVGAPLDVGIDAVGVAIGIVALRWAARRSPSNTLLLGRIATEPARGTGSRDR